MALFGISLSLRGTPNYFLLVKTCRLNVKHHGVPSARAHRRFSRSCGSYFSLWSGKAVASVVSRCLVVPGSIAFTHGPWKVALCKSRRIRDPPPSSRHPYGRLRSQQTSTHHLKWSQLWSFIKSDVWLLVVAVTSAVFAALFNTLIPLRLGELVNVVAQLEPGLSLHAYTVLLMPAALSLLTLYLAQSACTFGYISVLSVVGERLATKMRSALFKSLLQQDMTFFDEHKTGELISRLSGDIQDLKSSFKMVISQGLRSVTQGVGCIVSVYLISPQMTAVVAMVLPLIVVTGSLFGAVLRTWSRNAQEQVAIATGIADEAISNMRTVRAFAMEESEHRLYFRQVKDAESASVKLGNGVALFQALSNLAINGVVLGVVSHGGLLLVSNQLSSGELMAFLVAAQTIQRSLGTLSVLFGQVVRAVSSGSRVMEFMNIKPSVALHGGQTFDKNSIRGEVVFKDVTFSYPSRKDQVVLSELCLELRAGQVTALCGPSGAGKSTVASLLERFYETASGTIEIDGHELCKLDPSWLRGEIIGYISQEPVLFGTTVMENIRYGCPMASDSEVKEAAVLANAHHFIEQFPNGYSTLVGERGIALSGGQKQRVAIARALLKNPPILILDEATSALDAHAESLVQEALDRACKGRTVLVIAHRLSTIQRANQIAVLHHGKLREVGTHAQLVSKKGLYFELIRKQSVVN